MITSKDIDVAPLYTLLDASRIIGLPANTLRGWARGYRYKGTDGKQRDQDALITTTGPGRGAVVPFVGLVEGYVLNAFRESGVPMQRIRPALARLDDAFGLHTALASKQLMTDGAEVLWRFGEETHDPELRDQLVMIRNNQLVFREVIEDYLQTITYDGEGNVTRIRLPRYRTDVVVDPRVNFGQPTLPNRGIRIADVIDRLNAGEDAAELASDYLLDINQVLALAA